MEANKAEAHRHLLRCLLHYHERMMLGTIFDAGSGGELCSRPGEGQCARVIFQDGYAEALREAIRCIEIVHKDELSGG